MQLETDVVVVGGGATVASVLWDLALRGIDAVLVDRSDLGTGTSGRWHGELHSGARYAVRDPESARECVEDNAILRRIARTPSRTSAAGSCCSPSTTRPTPTASSRAAPPPGSPARRPRRPRPGGPSPS
jgi:glycerol-3-phosphate dehydrogenase